MSISRYSSVLLELPGISETGEPRALLGGVEYGLPEISIPSYPRSPDRGQRAELRAWGEKWEKRGAESERDELIYLPAPSSFLQWQLAYHFSLP